MGRFDTGHAPREGRAVSIFFLNMKRRSVIRFILSRFEKALKKDSAAL
jgi:hypothetical protein